MTKKRASVRGGASRAFSIERLVAMCADSVRQIKQLRAKGAAMKLLEAAKREGTRYERQLARALRQAHRYGPGKVRHDREAARYRGRTQFPEYVALRARNLATGKWEEEA